MTNSIYNTNYDLYLRDYLINLLINDGSNLKNLVFLSGLTYLVYFILSLKMSTIIFAGISKYISGVYSLSLYHYFVTPIIEVMYNVHREYYIILTAILVIILYVLYIELTCFRDVEYRYSINNNFVLELVWSILPALIIFHFMLMTIALLYISDEHTFFGFQVKVVGHQWYWEYDVAKCFSSLESIYTNMSDAIVPQYDMHTYTDRNKINDLTNDNILIDLINSSNHLVKYPLYINYSAERLLDTEGVLYVPYHTHVRLLITSMDVIHSFTIPSLGIKTDAIPGRLNDLHFFLTDSSAMIHYFGQCSELCGVGHAFMPIHMLSI